MEIKSFTCKAFPNLTFFIYKIQLKLRIIIFSPVHTLSDLLWFIVVHPGKRIQNFPVHTLSDSLWIYCFPPWKADSKISPSTHYWIRCGFIAFHSGERIQKFPRPHVIGFVVDVLFPTLESGFKNNQIRPMRVDASLIRKEKLRIQKYPDKCGRGLKGFAMLETWPTFWKFSDVRESLQQKKKKRIGRFELSF